MKTAYVSPGGWLLGWTKPRDPADGVAKVELLDAKGGGLDIVLSTWVEDLDAKGGGHWVHFGAAPLEEPWPWWVDELPDSVLAWLTSEKQEETN